MTSGSSSDSSLSMSGAVGAVAAPFRYVAGADGEYDASDGVLVAGQAGCSAANLRLGANCEAVSPKTGAGIDQGRKPCSQCVDTREVVMGVD